MNAALAANSSAPAPVPEKIAVGVGEAKSWREKNNRKLLERIRIVFVAYYKNEIN